MRKKDTHGLLACVLCKEKGHTANYLGLFPGTPKRAPSPVKVTPRPAPARPVSALSYVRAAVGPRGVPPTTSVVHRGPLKTAHVDNIHYRHK
ncbi:hypothetical protein EVAR_37722_1 [Eumeta japonica]|uniref:Uncharacterized protein n=1 Tax=Eumeta variegata TaxID=151549 RepID=A0A4C1YKF8_EUMVA|nr:hypothetical protein EVAR_37722_1 [Eumeta japonica]